MIADELWIASIIIFLISFNISLFTTPVTRKFSVSRRFSDRKDERTVHKKVITRLGGTAIYAGITASLLILFFMGKLRQEIPPLLTGMTIIFLVGIIDDIKDTPSIFKLIMQTAATLIIIYSGFRVSSFTIPFSEASIKLPLYTSYALTIIWILLITNAVNFIDGLDGLAAGIMTISCFFLFATSIRTGRPDIAVPFLAISGSCLGFLRHNFHPAKVFMGDAGSTTIGFAVACLTLFGTIKAPAVFPLLIPLVALGIPATDVCLAVFRRIKNKKSPLSPDKNHLHHKLLDIGLPHKDAVLILYGITIILGIIAFNSSPHPSLATGGFALVSLGIILTGMKRILSRAKHRHKKKLQQQKKKA